MLQKSAVTDDVVRPFHLGRRGLVPDPNALYATFTLRNTESLRGRRSRNKRCEPPQVLSDGGENELILGASRTTQSKPAELQDALQVREPHLDLLALTAWLLEGFGGRKRTGNVSGAFMDIARDLPQPVGAMYSRFRLTLLSRFYAQAFCPLNKGSFAPSRIWFLISDFSRPPRTYVISGLCETPSEARPINLNSTTPQAGLTVE
jgi:hypothetical protein